MKFISIVSVFILSTLTIAQQQTLSVVSNGETRYITSYDREGTIYFSIKEYAEALSLNYFYNDESKKIELKFDKYTWKASAKNPFIVIKERSTSEENIVQLPTSTFLINDVLLIPLEYSLQTLMLVSGNKLEFKSPGKLFVGGIDESDTKVLSPPISGSKFDIVGISVDEKANGTLIKLKSNKRIPSYASSYKNNVLTLTFRKVNVDADKIDYEGTGGVIKKIEAKNTGKDAELKFYVGKEYAANEVMNVDNSNDLLITIHNKLFANKETTDKYKEKWDFDVIVIDAGHGGKDAGTIGVNNVKEKDVNLGIALKLGKLIEENMKDVKVVYTRKTDTFVDLYKRGKIANENGGKLFISIHCNATPKKPSDANGFEVYLLRPGRTKEAIAIAEVENSVIQYEENPERYEKLTDENFILVTMAHSSYMKYSEKFAEFLHKEFSKHSELNSRGVKQAGFYVLVGASMPSVLIESGFLSNRNDAKHLSSKSGQQKFAEFTFNAIKNYRQHYEREMQSE